MIIVAKKRLTYQKESVMDNRPDEKVVDIEKKVYATPELVEHGTLSQVTKSGPNATPEDLELASDPTEG